MDCSGIPIGELLPHGPEMTVIDRLVEYSPQRSIATVVVRESSPFFVSAGVPAWVGIEYMAQTIAAHAGVEARLRGERPAIGFLLGTRAYESEVGEFPLGCGLTITVEPVVVEARLAAFKCSIATDHVVATATVNTYQPAAHELAASRGGVPSA
jgi:predicted hotdog family 3-hydroxylacyl-ACP dehydratase